MHIEFNVYGRSSYKGTGISSLPTLTHAIEHPLRRPCEQLALLKVQSIEGAMLGREAGQGQARLWMGPMDLMA